MSTGSIQPSAIPLGLAVAPELRSPPTPPVWVARLVEAGHESTGTLNIAGRGRSGTMSIRAAGAFALASARLPAADGLDVTELRGGTAAVYRAIRDALLAAGTPHPIRMWNFIPGIHEPVAEGIDRYQAFNMGRFDGFSEWLGAAERFPELLPTATGVGHEGHALLVFALGAAAPGSPVDNPRQRPAFRYSRRYGPRPPCFARATRAALPEGASLLIGGTASVRGEDSMHVGSLNGQLTEMFDNLGVLVGGEETLGLIRDARVYYRRGPDALRIRDAVTARLPGARRVELVRADLCRRELLVELEAVAECPARI